ncbi:MAG: response regulator [Gammaproteobacteria bacterium]|nr:response regulator [Gammaproteobacteria bacterium]
MSDQAQVLIVEDEPKIAELLRDYLQQSHYATHVIDNGDAVDDWVRNNNPDIVLLDLMLPGKDGLTVCRELRSHTDVPIIMVTARVDEIDRLLGLELGADDYICKPFSAREVVARVKALLRRIEMARVNPEAVYRGLAIDEEKFAVSIDGQVLDLTPVEFRLLALLASQPGRVFSRDQLMNRIYVDGRVVSDRTVDSHVKNLRQKIHSVVGSDDMIRSIYGVGYKLD